MPSPSVEFECVYINYQRASDALELGNRDLLLLPCLLLLLHIKHGVKNCRAGCHGGVRPAFTAGFAGLSRWRIESAMHFFPRVRSQVGR